METDPIAAFVSREDPLEITVNFGVLAGRELDRAEVDSLGESLLRLVGGFTLFAGRRYEFASGAAEVVASCRRRARSERLRLDPGRPVQGECRVLLDEGSLGAFVRPSSSHS